MTVEKKSNSTKITKNEKKGKTDLQREGILKKNIKLNKDDKILEKVEKYVDKNREKTSQEIMERKTTRPVKQYQEGDLEVMISKVGVQNKLNENGKKTSKRILYIIYVVVFIVILIFTIKYFFALNMPQIS